VASEGRQRAIIGKGDHFVANENSVTRIDARGVEWMAGIMQTVLVRQMLPTPTVFDSNNAPIRKKNNLHEGGRHGVSLKDMIPVFTGMLPTPTSSEHKYRLNGDSQQSKCLEAKARRGEFSKISGEEIGGTGTSSQLSTKPKLNPEFVERMMGFPVGWTDLKRSETL
jgi:hypothetical protein